jgi:signal transduction histidine kinase
MGENTRALILVIDDEPAIRLGLIAAIKGRGHMVVAAEDGRDGLEKAREYLPDLIVSDVMMPPPDGFEMKRLMGSDPKLASIPFIFLTARTGVEDRVSGIRGGADDYLSKPFAIDELLARIDALLRRVREARERGREEMRQIARQDMEKLQKEILQNFHHELRTPLTNIIMPLQLAINNKFEDPAGQSRFIQMALSNADRLDSLILDIILLSNIDRGDLNLVRQSVSVEDHILAPALKRLERYKARELRFSHSLHDEGEIKAPRREFSQSVLHLVDNAFKFSPQNGNVSLEIHAGPNGAARIVVTDEGPGIPADQREKVFERFYQVSRGDTREYEGLGVGLRIAGAVFQSLGGSVQIMDVKKGCVVEAALPEIRAGDIVYG